MTSKEKFYLLKVLVISESKQYQYGCELHDLKKHEHISIQDCVIDIEKDLDRLEKYDKVKGFLKSNPSHLSAILGFDTLEEFKKYYSESYTKDVNEEIFNLVKEVFQ